MDIKGSHNLGLKPVERKDLMDYFPSLAEAFAGYIRQMVFRVTLAEVLSQTENRVITEMGQYNYDGSLNPLLRDENYERDTQQRKNDAYYQRFRETLYNLIQQTDWYRWDNDDSYARRSEEEASRYAMAAGYAVPKHFINKGVSKAAKRAGGRALSKGIASGNVPEGIGKVVGEFGLGTTHFIQSANGMFDLSINPTEKVVEKLHDKLQEKMGFDGVDTSFNNQDTRSFYSNLLHVDKKHEKYVGWGLETLDVVTDAVAYAEVPKLVEEVAINAFTAYRHHKDAEKEREAIAERNTAWENLTEDIKRYIQQDINTLSNEELTRLCELLEVKQ